MNHGAGAFALRAFLPRFSTLPSIAVLVDDPKRLEVGYLSGPLLSLVIHLASSRKMMPLFPSAGCWIGSVAL